MTDNDIVARMAAEDRTWLKFTKFYNRVMKSRQHKKMEIEKRGGFSRRRRRKVD